MHIVLFLHLIFSSGTEVFSEPGKLIWFPIEFGEVTTVAIQFDVALPLHDRVEVIFNFWILEAWNISGHYVIWNISERDIISNSETLMDSVLFFISKFI